MARENGLASGASNKDEMMAIAHMRSLGHPLLLVLVELASARSNDMIFLMHTNGWMAGNAALLVMTYAGR